MALLVNCDDNKVITVIIGGCHNGNECNHSNGCGKSVVLKEKFNIAISTPVTRLFLHVAFGRSYKIKEYMKKFDNYFDNGNNHDVDGIEYMKRVILEDLESDKSWKICPKCDYEYKEKKREFRHERDKRKQQKVFLRK